MPPQANSDAATIAILRVTLWRKSDALTLTLYDSTYPRASPDESDGPVITNVELDQSDKAARSHKDDWVVVVELADTQESWTTHDHIAWSGDWEPVGLLKPILDAVRRVGGSSPELERALDDPAAADALELPADLRLVYGESGYEPNDDEVLYRHYKGMASTTMAVIWPGEEALRWNLVNQTVEAGDIAARKVDPPTHHAFWSVVESTWRSAPYGERSGVHAVESLRLGLAASAVHVPDALRAAVERAEDRLQASLDGHEPDKRSDLPAMTVPVLRIGAMIGAVESRLSLVTSSVANTSVEDDVQAALKDVRSLRTEARGLVDVIGSVLAARHLELAEQRAAEDAVALRRDMTLQRYAASLGVVVLVPTLITAIFGANVALPYQDRALGLALLLLAATAAACLGLAAVRWRFPPGATSDSARGPVPKLLSATGAFALVATVALTASAVVSADFGSDDSVDQEEHVFHERLISDLHAVEHDHMLLARQHARLSSELAALLRRVEVARRPK
jgi:hypothetical protein